MIDENKLICELIERKNKTVILMARHGGKWYREYHQKMLDMIYDNFIEIIKKQPKCERDKPKKVKKHNTMYGFPTFECGECPNCGKIIVKGWSCQNQHEPNYCEECGQKLDWGNDRIGEFFQKVFIDENP